MLIEVGRLRCGGGSSSGASFEVIVDSDGGFCDGAGSCEGGGVFSAGWSSIESPLSRLVRFGGPRRVSLPRRGYRAVVPCPNVDAKLDCLQINIPSKYNGANTGGSTMQV
jgi:hypothetical protein